MSEPLAVSVRILPNGAGLPLPSYQSAGAAGLDLLAAVPPGTKASLPPGGRQLIPTGLALAIPHGYEGQIRPRSGLALKAGITCLNAPGTIDCDYRGEVGVILVNHGTEPFTIRRGDRIAQMVVARYERVEWQEVENLDDTARGAGGFGSTGGR